MKPCRHEDTLRCLSKRSGDTIWPAKNAVDAIVIYVAANALPALPVHKDLLVHKDLKDRQEHKGLQDLQVLRDSRGQLELRDQLELRVRQDHRAPPDQQGLWDRREHKVKQGNRNMDISMHLIKLLP